MPVPVFNVPAMFAPVDVTTKVVVPPAVILTLPPLAGIATLLVPLAKTPVILPDTLPTKVVAIIAPFARLALNAEFAAN